jgi:hypothetical protein
MLPGISAENQRVLLHRVRGRKPPDDTLPARSGPLQWGRGPTIGRAAAVRWLAVRARFG